LDATGLNWAIFSVRFQDAVEVKGFWGHFDGTSTCPGLSNPATADETAAKNQWEKNEWSAKSLLTQKIPDLTLMRVHSKTSVKDRWEAIVKEYMDKGAYTDAHELHLPSENAYLAHRHTLRLSLFMRTRTIAHYRTIAPVLRYRTHRTVA